MRQKEKIAVVGASGYAGEELLERLLIHPGGEIVCLTSRQHAGRRLYEVYPRFRRSSHGGEAREEPAFVAPDADAIIRSGARFAFLALPHGLASEFAVPLLAAGLRVIDLSADFRLRDAAVYRDFYGTSTPRRNGCRRRFTACRNSRAARGNRRGPARGRARMLSDEHPGAARAAAARGAARPAQILVSSMSGVSGAGRKADVDLLFAECNENARPTARPGIATSPRSSRNFPSPPEDR